jgi:conjugative relaxase-like TrwC/TraI family protein
MVTISKPLNSGQAQSYHKLEFTSESQTYWKRGGTVQGEWQGRLAEKMGLMGEVSAEHFARLADGQNPKTGEQMVQHRDVQEYKKADGTTTKSVEHRAGWDATFSAPKSVSLTALVGGDDRVREAHRNAVTTALGELERYTQARIGGNNPAETTGQFVAAKFEHDTARPVDGYAAPQLHTHAVIFNVTERADGSTRALQERGLFETQNFATAVYQSELTYQLRNLGYDIEPGRSGAPEIKGYSQEYLDASSPRSQQIKEHLEKIGFNSPEAAQIAAHSTRDGKQILTPDQVLNAHKEIAAAFGNQAEKIVGEACERAQLQERKPEINERAREAVSYAKESTFEREAVRDERVIMRDALRRGMGETPYSRVRAEFDSRLRRGEFQQIDGQKHDTGRSFTTPETIAAERANVEHMRAGKNTVEPMMTAERAVSQAETRDFLNTAQRTVIEEVLTSRDRIHGLQGLAGTGKTTTLETIKEGAEKSGYAVEGLAPTSKATGQLREAGISADTLQGFLARGGQDRMMGDPASRHLYMLDESSLASTRQMQLFLEKIGPQDRVLVIGDVRQHQGVDAGRPFEQMQDAGMRTAQLDRIMRQKDPELLKAVEHFSKNDTATGVELLAEQGRVTEIANPRERIQAIAKDYAARPENTIIVSPDNRSRQEINDAVRVELQASGALAKDGREFSTLVQRSDMTGADRGWAARYQPGDVLQYTKGSKAEGIERGSFATVLSANATENTVTVRRDDGQSVTYDPARLKGVNAYRETPREIATGDRIQFTAPYRKFAVANRDLGTVEKVESNQITVAMDGKRKRIVSFDPARMKHFDHGYALTSHSSQGLTAGRVLANIDTEAQRGLINTRLAYVAISRASEDARVYTNDAGTLSQKLAADVSKTTAVDFRPVSSVTELRQAIDALGKNETAWGVEMLQQQGRVREYADPNHRLAAVAVDYAAQPGRAVVVAPDPADRQQLTCLIRDELRRTGTLANESRSVPVLIEQTGNRQSAATYAPGDTIQYRAWSQIEGIAPNSSATVVAVEAKRNILTVQKTDGEQLSYSPHQQKQMTMQSAVYREERRDIALGERIQITVPDKEQGIWARDFGTVEKIADNNALTVRMDSGKTVELDPARARHIEHGYVVDGGKTVAADRVLVSLEKAPQLTKESIVYTAISRASQDAAIYTSDGSALARPVAQVDLHQVPSDHRHEPAHEQKQADIAGEIQPRQIEQQRPVEQPERVYTWAEHERHYAPLSNALTSIEADQFGWRTETGTIQSYQHNETQRHIHIDGATGEFYDGERNAISRNEALDHAMPAGHLHSQQDSPTQNSIEPGLSQGQPANDNSQGCGL